MSLKRMYFLLEGEEARMVALKAHVERVLESLVGVGGIGVIEARLVV